MAGEAKPAGSPNRAESLDEFRYLQQIYQSQYMLVTQQINSAIEYIKQLDAAQKTIEKSDSVKGKSALIPVGADTYVAGKLADMKFAVIGIGAGYLLEKNIDEAKKFIGARSEMEMQAVNRLMKNKAELENALINISYKIEEISH